MKDLGQTIKAIRKLKHFSQEVMADALSMDQSTYCKLEHSGDKVDFDVLKKIAKVFDMSIEKLVTLCYMTFDALTNEYNLPATFSETTRELELYKEKEKKQRRTSVILAESVLSLHVMLAEKNNLIQQLSLLK